MSNPIISIIVPVYNVEQYINRCIDSILAQSYTNFELILVDDGSTDDSGRICDNYSSKNNKVKTLHKINGGASAARLYGVNHSVGDWIMFVDSDDIIPSDCLAKIIGLFSDTCDILVGNGRYIDGRWFKQSYSGIITPDIYAELLLKARAMAGPVAKLFRKTLFDDAKIIVDKDIRQHEDLLMIISLLPYCRNINMDSTLNLYTYITREDSVSTGALMPINVWIKLFSYLEQRLLLLQNKENVFRAFNSYRLRCIYYCTLRNKSVINQKEEYINELIDTFKGSQKTKDEIKYISLLTSPVKLNIYLIKRKIISYVKSLLRIILCNHTGNCMTCSKYSHNNCIKNKFRKR